MTPYPSALEKFPRIRQSLLSTFDDCALATKFEQDYGMLPEGFVPTKEGKVEWGTHPTGRGQLTHRALGKCLEEMARQGENRMEADVATAILLEVLRQHDVPPEEVVTVPMKHVIDIYWIVRKWALDNVWEVDKLVDVERRLDAILRYPDPEGGFVERTMTGQLDALFVEGENLERGIVLDWKDTWALPPQSEVSERGFFQQRFYGWLIFRNYPTLQSVTLREFYVRRSQVREATVYRSNVEEIEAEMMALVERFDRAVETNVWRPTPGKHCSYCLRPTACPIFPKARQVGQISSEEEAEQAAAQVVVAEAALKQHKDALKAWVDVHGAVPVKDAKSNRVYGYQQSNRTSSPKAEDIQKFVLSQGGNVTEEQIEAALYKKAATTRFTAHIPKPTVEPDDDILEKLQLSVEAAEERKRGRS